VLLALTILAMVVPAWYDRHMNIPILIVMLLLGHVLGDFYFQRRCAEDKKRTFLPWLLLHWAVYSAGIIMALGSLVKFGGVEFSRNLLWIFLFVSISHLAVDFCNILYRENSGRSLTIDQAAHLVSIFIAYMIWGNSLEISSFLYEFSGKLTIALGLLIIMRPVGLWIESLNVWPLKQLAQSPDDMCDAHEDALQKDVSRIIGYLERIIMYFLLLSGQYSAIGLVVAAKSIARFPEINNKNSWLQANYYIVGTFLSLVAVISVSVVLGFVP